MQPQDYNGPTLETSRLILRPLALSDAPDIQREFGRWEIIQHLSVTGPWPYPKDGAAQFVRERLAFLQQHPENRTWVITLRTSDELIGLIDYMSEDTGAGNRGFWLGVPWQGKGYMTEAVEAVQDYLFFEQKIERIIVGNALNNPASRRIKEKTGAKWLGYHTFEHRDGESRAEQWEVTAEAWTAYRSQD